VEDIIVESIDVMKAYLFQYFYNQAIFNAPDSDRNLTIVKHLKGIVILEIYTRNAKNTSF
jgi:hypothetical protein